MMEFSNFVTIKKIFKVLLKLQNNRNFEIIGEAANRLPEDYKYKYEDIDWHRIRGFRNRIVHDYFGIDYAIVWEIKITFLPKLIKRLNEIVS